MQKTLIGVIAGALLLTTPLMASEPLDLVPADTMMAWYGRPIPGVAAEGGGPNPLNVWLDMASLAGEQLEPRTKLNISILKAAAEMVGYRHVLALIDTSAQHGGSHPDSRQLHDVKFAFIVEARDKAGRFKRIVQDTLNQLVTAQQARLSPRTAAGFEYYELVDTRLPEWAVVAWGDIGPYFVITVGDGVWPRVAATAAGEMPAMSRDPWIADVRGDRGRNALIEIFVASDHMKRQLDEVLEGRVTRFFAAWDAEKMQRAHWAIGLNDQTLYCIAHFILDGKRVERIYAQPVINDPQALKLIPDGARHAVYEVDAARVLRNVIGGLYVWQAEETRERAIARWREIEREYGFDTRRDILDNLGDTIIIHNFPEHPLKLPVFFTTLVEIDQNHQKVADTINMLCDRWRLALKKDAEERGIADPAVIHEQNGIWSIKVGVIDVMAWTVEGQYLVISWSPKALRDYLREVGDELAPVRAAQASN